MADDHEDPVSGSDEEFVAKKRKKIASIDEDETVANQSDADSDIPEAKKSIKKIVKDMFANEASEESDGGSDSESAEEEADDEIGNDYVIDGFVVRDDSGIRRKKKDVSDDDDDEAPKKGQLSRLKKRKDQVQLDSDDLILIQDNIRANQVEAESENDSEGDGDENVIEPIKVAKRRVIREDGSDAGSDAGGDYEDGAEDGDDQFVAPEDGEDAFDGEEGDEKRAVPSQRRFIHRSNAFKNGPSFEQLMEAEDIFGEGFNMEDLEDDENDFAVSAEDGSTPAAAASAGQSEASILAALRSKFDRVQLVSNFCMPNDDFIRQVDRPERFLDSLALKARVETPDDEERGKEASWIARQVAEKIKKEAQAIGNDFINEEALVEEILEPVTNVLKFFQVDQLEVPFIWNYRKDYLHSVMTRSHLWYIASLDEKWEQLYAAKTRVYNTINDLIKSSTAGSDDLMARLRAIAGDHADDSEGRNADLPYSPEIATEVLRLFPKERYQPIIEGAATEAELKDITAYLNMYIVAASSAHPSQSTRSVPSAKKDRYFKLCSIPRIREFLEQISVPVSELGDALRYGFKIDPPETPSVAITDLAMDYVPLDSMIVNDENEVIKAATFILATELSTEPNVRRIARSVFRDRATISTRPTPKGVGIINPFNELFGLHYLNKKPVKDFYVGKDRTLFIRLLEAKSQGLIEVTIHPPERDAKIDLEAFLLPTGILATFLPKIPDTEDPNVFTRPGYDEFRKNVLNECFQTHLIPLLIAEVKRDLLRVGREAIIEESAAKFEKMLSHGPFRPAPFEDNQSGSLYFGNNDIKNLLSSCPLRPFYGTVMSIYLSAGERQPIFMAYVDKNGVLRAHETLPEKALNTKGERLRSFILEHLPDVIVLNASGGMASRGTESMLAKNTLREVERTLEVKRRERKQLREHKFGRYDDDEEDDDDDDSLPKSYKPSVLLVKDEVSLIFKNSQRAQKMFPDLQPGTSFAISLARFVQEPLTEYCGLWWSADAADTFGFETLFLDLHPNKNLLRGNSKPLLKALERCLVDAVCDVGVDINMAVSYDHYATMLAFVGGLGLRKADALRKSIRNNVGFLENRQDLLRLKIIGTTVYKNCAGFLRIRHENFEEFTVYDEDPSRGISRHLNPLDDTRIHPECYAAYDFVQKICADALDDEQEDRVDGDEAVKQLMRKVRLDVQKQFAKKRWLDLWSSGKRPTGSTYKDVKKDGFTEVDRPVELADDLQMLLLDDFAEEQAKQNKGKRRLQLEQIKDELRFPWLDLRTPIGPPSQQEIFSIITGESDASLHIGLQIGVTVQSVNSSVRERMGRDGPFLVASGGLSVRADNGIKGYISVNEMFDDRDAVNGFKIEDKFKVGQSFAAVVTEVQKDRIQLKLATKPSLMNKSERWWLESRHNSDFEVYWKSVGKTGQLFDRYFQEENALRAYEEANASESPDNKMDVAPVGLPSTTSIASSAPVKGKSLTRIRHVHHPLFSNCNFKEAEDRLRREGKGAGEVIIRPSSKGPDSLTITWAFQENSYLHIDVSEKGKKSGDLGIGNQLYINEPDIATECYSDLDEIYARYIEPLNDFVQLMIRHKNFRKGTPDEVVEYMKQCRDNEPARIPYCIRLEPRKPGVFVLTWLSLNVNSAQPVKLEYIFVRPYGYKIKDQSFKHPNDLINWFKAATTAAMHPQAPAKAGVPAASGSGTAPRRPSRFSQHIPVPAPLPGQVPLPMPLPVPMPIPGMIPGLYGMPQQGISHLPLHPPPPSFPTGAHAGGYPVHGGAYPRR